jgi:hypothetical protein
MTTIESPTMYIGTVLTYAENQLVEDPLFFNTIDLAKGAAQRKAEENSMLFGSVYEITTIVDNNGMRHPYRVVKHVDWSI